MSDNRLENVRQLISLQQHPFELRAKVHGAVNFVEEATYALQLLQKNDYLCGIAMKNQDSLKNAILNVAMVGISLNPFKKEAYLIPRKSEICLDVSYVGYKNMYFNEGALLWCVTELHHEKDQFEWIGFDSKPFHKIIPFEDRGKLLGCYCAVKIPSGDILAKYMSIKEIYYIRDTFSESWKGKNRIYSPWFTHEESMIRKTVVRNSKEMWPHKSKRLEQVERIVTLADGTPGSPLLTSGKEDVARQDLILKIRSGLELVGWTQEQHLEICARAYGHPNLAKLEDLTMNELTQALRMLNQEIDHQNSREKK